MLQTHRISRHLNLMRVPVMTGEAVKDNKMTRTLDEMMAKLTRITRNWSQNYQLLKDRTSFYPDELSYMKQLRNAAETAADDLFDVMEEDSEQYNMVLKKIDLVRFQMSAMNHVLNGSNARAAAPHVTIADLPTVEDVLQKLLPKEVQLCQVLPKLMEDPDPVPDLPQEEVSMSQLVPSVVGARLIIGLPVKETTIAKILVLEDSDDLPKECEEVNDKAVKEVAMLAKRDEKDVSSLAHVPVQKPWSTSSPSVPAGWPSVPSLYQALQPGVQWCAAANQKLFPADLIGTLNIRNSCDGKIQSKIEIQSEWTQQQQQQSPVTMREDASRSIVTY